MRKIWRILGVLALLIGMVVFAQPVQAAAMGTIADLIGTISGSPVTLGNGANTITVTVVGTLTVTLSNGNVGTAVSGTCTVNGSPVTLPAGATVITTSVATGTITINTNLSNPTSITFGADPTYGAFFNILETGDMCFISEAYVKYTVTPMSYTATQAFSFQVLNNAGTVVMTSTPLNEYGDRPIGIYFSKDDALALGLVKDTLYRIRISGNATVFTTLTEGTNMKTITLAPGNWFDHSLSTDVIIIMRALILGGGAYTGMVFNIDTTDTPAVHYYALSSGRYYLNMLGSPSGQSIFLQGIPGLDVMCPSAFMTSTTPMVSTEPPHTGAGQTPITVTNKLGTQTAATMSAITVALGLPDTAVGRTVSGVIVTVVLMVALFYWLSKKGFDDQRVLGVAGIAMLALATMFGIIPMAGLFVIIMVILVIMVFYFLARGV